MSRRGRDCCQGQCPEVRRSFGPQWSTGTYSAGDETAFCSNLKQYERNRAKVSINGNLVNRIVPNFCIVTYPNIRLDAPNDEAQYGVTVPNVRCVLLSWKDDVVREYLADADGFPVGSPLASRPIGAIRYDAIGNSSLSTWYNTSSSAPTSWAWVPFVPLYIALIRWKSGYDRSYDSNGAIQSPHDSRWVGYQEDQWHVATTVNSFAEFEGNKLQTVRRLAHHNFSPYFGGPVSSTIAAHLNTSRVVAGTIVNGTAVRNIESFSASANHSYSTFLQPGEGYPSSSSAGLLVGGVSCDVPINENVPHHQDVSPSSQELVRYSDRRPYYADYSYGGLELGYTDWEMEHTPVSMFVPRDAIATDFGPSGEQERAIWLGTIERKNYAGYSQFYIGLQTDAEYSTQVLLNGGTIPTVPTNPPRLTLGLLSYHTTWKGRFFDQLAAYTQFLATVGVGGMPDASEVIGGRYGLARLNDFTGFYQNISSPPVGVDGWCAWTGNELKIRVWVNWGETIPGGASLTNPQFVYNSVIEAIGTVDKSDILFVPYSRTRSPNIPVSSAPPNVSYGPPVAYYLIDVTDQDTIDTGTGALGLSIYNGPLYDSLSKLSIANAPIYDWPST
jgi:hypothetical protein